MGEEDEGEREMKRMGQRHGAVRLLFSPSLLVTSASLIPPHTLVVIVKLSVSLPSHCPPSFFLPSSSLPGDVTPPSITIIYDEVQASNSGVKMLLQRNDNRPSNKKRGERGDKNKKEAKTTVWQCVLCLCVPREEKQNCGT